LLTGITVGTTRPQKRVTLEHLEKGLGSEAWGPIALQATADGRWTYQVKAEINGCRKVTRQLS